MSPDPDLDNTADEEIFELTDIVEKGTVGISADDEDFSLSSDDVDLNFEQELEDLFSDEGGDFDSTISDMQAMVESKEAKPEADLSEEMGMDELLDRAKETGDLPADDMDFSDLDLDGDLGETAPEPEGIDFDQAGGGLDETLLLEPEAIAAKGEEVEDLDMIGLDQDDISMDITGEFEAEDAPKAAGGDEDLDFSELDDLIDDLDMPESDEKAAEMEGDIDLADLGELDGLDDVESTMTMGQSEAPPKEESAEPTEDLGFDLEAAGLGDLDDLEATMEMPSPRRAAPEAAMFEPPAADMSDDEVTLAMGEEFELEGVPQEVEFPETEPGEAAPPPLPEEAAPPFVEEGPLSETLDAALEELGVKEGPEKTAKPSTPGSTFDQAEIEAALASRTPIPDFSNVMARLASIEKKLEALSSEPKFDPSDIESKITSALAEDSEPMRRMAGMIEKAVSGQAEKTEALSEELSKVKSEDSPLLSLVDKRIEKAVSEAKPDPDEIQAKLDQALSDDSPVISSINEKIEAAKAGSEPDEKKLAPILEKSLAESQSLQTLVNERIETALSLDSPIMQNLTQNLTDKLSSEMEALVSKGLAGLEEKSQAGPDLEELSSKLKDELKSFIVSQAPGAAAKVVREEIEKLSKEILE